MKKSVLILICVLVALHAVIAVVVIKTTSRQYEYVIMENGTLKITKFSGWAHKVNIPKMLDGYKVTSIGDKAFYGCSSVTSITIPNTVTSIGYSAFCECESLTEIYIPESVTDIRYKSFDSRGQLTLIVEKDSYAENYAKDLRFAYAYPEKVRYEIVLLDDGTAEIKEYIGLMNEVTIPNKINGYLVTSIGKTAFSSSDYLTKVTIPDTVISIGEGAFQYCESLTTVILPKGITFIADEAFYACESLVDISIPDTVTSIGTFAFGRCTSLSKIHIPDSVTFIGQSAFSNCNSLSVVVVPNGITSIEKRAFSSCDALRRVMIPNSVTSIGEGAFYFCHNLCYINIPDGVTSIGAEAFSSCFALEKIDIPDSVAFIGEEAFMDCRGLKRIKISNSMTSIGESVFMGCMDLEELVISNSVTSIGESAFERCTSITKISIPDSVTTIGYRAFFNCYSLEEIFIPNSVVSIAKDVFRGDSKLSIVAEKGSCAEQYAKKKYINFTPHVDFMKYRLMKDGTAEITNYFGTMTEVVIPNEVEGHTVSSIGNGAFQMCDSLTLITVPDSVNAIEDEAFIGCGESLTFVVGKNSYAEKYAKSNNIRYTNPVELPNAETAQGNESLGLNTSDEADAAEEKECPHTSLYVSVSEDRDSYEYEYINKAKHKISFLVLEKSLCCYLCGERIQTLHVNARDSYERKHTWDWCGSCEGNKQQFICEKCGYTKIVRNPCLHGNYYWNEFGRMLCCNECNKFLKPDETVACKHDNLTILYDGTTRTWYSEWDEELHLKTEAVWKYNSQYHSNDYLDAVCNDCGIIVEYNTKTNTGHEISGSNMGDPGIDAYVSVLENHKFDDGICVDCGYSMH